MVVDPHDPDGEKADGVRDVGRPQMKELVLEISVGDRLLKSDRKDQQGDRNREHAVAERFDPAGLHWADAIAPAGNPTRKSLWYRSQ